MNPNRLSKLMVVSLVLTLAAQNALAEPPKDKSPRADPAELDQRYKLATPSYLPELAREFLRRRMQRHGRDMQELLFAVVLLQREVARDTATRIAEEPRLARPEVSDGDDNVLNKALPPRFFVLQDELRDRAKKLADAARRSDDKALSSAWSKLSETCISCHSVYLNP